MRAVIHKVKARSSKKLIQNPEISNNIMDYSKLNN